MLISNRGRKYNIRNKFSFSVWVHNVTTVCSIPDKWIDHKVNIQLLLRRKRLWLKQLSRFLRDMSTERLSFRKLVPSRPTLCRLYDVIPDVVLYGWRETGNKHVTGGQIIQPMQLSQLRLRGITHQSSTGFNYQQLLMLGIINKCRGTPRAISMSLSVRYSATAASWVTALTSFPGPFPRQPKGLGNEVVTALWFGHWREKENGRRRSLRGATRFSRSNSGSKVGGENIWQHSETFAAIWWTLDLHNSAFHVYGQR